MNETPTLVVARKISDCAQFWLGRHFSEKQEREIAAIIQRHAPQSMESELAEALRAVLTIEPRHSLNLITRARINDSARAVLARFDAKGGE